MQFLDWLDRHFTSNSHFYFYADELGWPLDYYPHGLTEDGRPSGADGAQANGPPKQTEPH
jgi:hypothetical protein